MKHRKGISIRLSHQRVEALIEIMDEMQDGLEPQNEHQELLNAHLKQIHFTLQNIVKKNQDLYTLNLGATESIAFHQVWKMYGGGGDKYAQLIVDTLLKKIQNA